VAIKGIAKASPISCFKVPPLTKAVLVALGGDRAGIKPQTAPSVEVATASFSVTGPPFSLQVPLAQEKCEQFLEDLKYFRVNLNCVVILI
jgi:hypothetical protein